jgi:predicted AAA+ superfamily ATPase
VKKRGAVSGQSPGVTLPCYPQKNDTPLSFYPGVKRQGYIILLDIVNQMKYINRMNYTAFQLQNPWRTGNFQDDGSIPREIFPSLWQDIDKREITVITGSRQVGKTTLLMDIVSQLLQNQVPAEAVFYFNLDDFNLHPYFDNYTDFIEFIKSEYKGFAYIFIDEVQRLKNPGLFLKIINDLKLQMKLVVSGSSSLELKAKISEHLTGRKHTFEISPFSFEEFLSTRKVTYYSTKDLEALVKFHSQELSKLLMEFVTWGGYPKAVLAEGIKAKTVELKEIYDSYIKKDVADFLKIENIGGYNNLIKGLALQSGNILNYNELSLLSGLNVQTVKKYLDYLEGTYIFKRVPPFFSNPRKEISKSPKIYAYDMGLMNYITDRLKSEISDTGSLMENYVFTELVKKGLEVKFWRTGAGAEVDFIVNGAPVEVKASVLNSPLLTKSFFSYLETYKPVSAYLINNNFYGKREVEGKTVYFYPLWAVPLLVKERIRF